MTLESYGMHSVMTSTTRVNYFDNDPSDKLYKEIMDSLWINQLNKDQLAISIPIIQLIYRSNGEAQNFQRALSLIAYACYAIDDVNLNSQKVNRYDDFMCFKYLTAAMLYNTMQDNANALTPKEVINLFDIEVPKYSWWWEFFDQAMYNTPKKLMENPSTHQVFHLYSFAELNVIRSLDVYARIIFGLSILNDIERMKISISSDWLAQVCLVVFSIPVGNDDENLSLSILYRWIYLRIKKYSSIIDSDEAALELLINNTALMTRIYNYAASFF